jgi:hypothetical protein
VTLCYYSIYPFPFSPKRERLAAPSPLGEGWEGGGLEKFNKITQFEHVLTCDALLLFHLPPFPFPPRGKGWPLPAQRDWEGGGLEKFNKTTQFEHVLSGLNIQMHFLIVSLSASNHKAIKYECEKLQSHHT